MVLMRCVICEIGHIKYTWQVVIIPIDMFPFFYSIACVLSDFIPSFAGENEQINLR